MSGLSVVVPDMGSDDAVDVIEVNVAVGDRIAVEDTIAVLESAKATVEVPSSHAGVVKSLLIKVGDRVVSGDPLVELDVDVEREVEADDAGSEAGVSIPVGSMESAETRVASSEAIAQSEAAMPASSAAASMQDIAIPDIGGGEADVIELSVKVGDEIAAEQTLLVLESDKATMEIPSPVSGRVVEWLLSVGDRVTEGLPMARVEAQGAVADKDVELDQPKTETTAPDQSLKESKAADSTVAQAPVSSVPTIPTSTKNNATVYAGPAVRKLARELGVDITNVVGTGPRKRIQKDDVHAYVKQQMQSRATVSGSKVATGAGLPPLPEIDFSQFGPVESVELNKIKRLTATNLHRAWLHIPHVTQFDEADITELEAFRKSEGVRLKAEGTKLTMLAFLVKACASALRAFPNFNASLSSDGTQLILKQYCHIGIAVDTPNGLVVPVIRDADKKSLTEIAQSLMSLSEKARDKKLMPADMQGGCFSISSLGGIGGTAFTPIVNWPEVAILGVSRSQMKPVFDGAEMRPRLMLPLSLSYDHRVIDGADAARFTTYLSHQLSDIRRLLL